MRTILVCLLGLAALAHAGCSGKKAILEFQSAVMYEKPRIDRVMHTLVDSRRDGGAVVAEITISGDPGLRASFDISPGIAEREPMTEGAGGTYIGSFTFPPELVGGPYTIIGRLEHEQAGEVTRRDTQSVTITILPPAR